MFFFLTDWNPQNLISQKSNEKKQTNKHCTNSQVLWVNWKSNHCSVANVRKKSLSYLILMGVPFAAADQTLQRQNVVSAKMISLKWQSMHVTKRTASLRAVGEKSLSLTTKHP